MAVHSSSGMVSVGVRLILPAQLTRMSIFPNCARASSRTRSNEERSHTSEARRRVCRPIASIAAAVSSTCCWRRAVAITSAPASASPSESARPMPDDPPVTTATFPSRLSSCELMLLSLSKPAVMRPKAQSRISDEEDIFAIDPVVSVLKFSGEVTRKHCVEIGVAKPDAFNLFARKLSWAPRNVEAAFRRCVDKMRRRTQIARKIGVRFNSRQSCRSAVVAILADQFVDGFVFAELLHAWCKNDQVSAVGQRHAGAIDGFVAQPRGVKLMRVEIDDGLGERLVNDF